MKLLQAIRKMQIFINKVERAAHWMEKWTAEFHRILSRSLILLYKVLNNVPD